ncbi:MAG: hypothetical protein GY719_26670 [bacterium]|nr:hypothetical protein [bacterium]
MSPRIHDVQPSPGESQGLSGRVEVEIDGHCTVSERVRTFPGQTTQVTIVLGTITDDSDPISVGVADDPVPQGWAIRAIVDDPNPIGG